MGCLQHSSIIQSIAIKREINIKQKIFENDSCVALHTSIKRASAGKKRLISSNGALCSALQILST
jgi:hypothetical protein